MFFGHKKPLKVCDLNFPLLNYSKKITVKEVAKKKLLTGNQIFELTNNKCNALKYYNKDWYILVPSVDCFKGSVDYFDYNLNSFGDSSCLELNFLEHECGDLYRFVSHTVSSYILCLVTNKTIMCMFSVETLTRVNITRYNDLDNYI